MRAPAEVLVQTAEDAYNDKNIEQVLALFTPDAVFYKNGRLVCRGTDALRRWHEKFFAAVKDHRLKKTFRAASGDTIAVESADTWVSADSGQPMVGCGSEFWVMDGDRLRELRLYYLIRPRP